MDKTYTKTNSSFIRDQIKVLKHNSTEPRNCRNYSHYVSVLDGLRSLRTDQFLCDISLKADDGIIVFRHKNVLMAASPYFRAMFSNFDESKKDLVYIRELDSNVLELLVNYIYTGEILITKENVQSLLPAANILQLDYVNDACSKFLVAQLNPSNCLSIKAFADLNNSMGLLSSSEAYIKKEFLHVAECDQFLALSCNEIIKLISCDDLFVPYEEKVFTCVINWIKYELDSRKDFLPQLMEHIRLPLMSSLFILNEVAKESLIKNSPKCNDYIAEALNFRKLKAQRRITIPQTIRMLSRHTLGIANWYDPIMNFWKSAPDLSTSRETAGLVIIADQFVFALGGVNDAPSRSVEMLDLSSHSLKWEPMVWMLVGRKSLGVGVINDCVYAIGGFDGKSSLNNAEVFDISIHKWRMISSMSMKRSCIGVGVLDNLLYVVGGYDHSTLKSLKSVECYEPSLDTWTQVAEISTCRSGVGVEVLDGLIYAVGGLSGSKSCKTVEAYSPSAGIWTSIADMHKPRAYAGVIALNGLLYVLGGIDVIFPLSSIEIYNPTTNSWELKEIDSYTIGQIYAGVVFNKPHNFSMYN